jgi:hypothetical protein
MQVHCRTASVTLIKRKLRKTADNHTMDEIDSEFREITAPATTFSCASRCACGCSFRRFDWG